MERGHPPPASAQVTGPGHRGASGVDVPLLDALKVGLDLEVLHFCVNPGWKVGGVGINPAQWEGCP